MPRALSALASASRLALVTAALAAVAAGGCANSDLGLQATAETEGVYLDINGLKYHVQLSRYMNPADVEDREYFVGLPRGTAQATGDETWFGVWVRVENVSD